MKKDRFKVEIEKRVLVPADDEYTYEPYSEEILTPLETIEKVRETVVRYPDGEFIMKDFESYCWTDEKGEEWAMNISMA